MLESGLRKLGWDTGLGWFSDRRSGLRHRGCQPGVFLPPSLRTLIHAKSEFSSEGDLSTSRSSHLSFTCNLHILLFNSYLSWRARIYGGSSRLSIKNYRKRGQHKWSCIPMYLLMQASATFTPVGRMVLLHPPKPRRDQFRRNSPLLKTLVQFICMNE